jgi:hypothetical protein
MSDSGSLTNTFTRSNYDTASVGKTTDMMSDGNIGINTQMGTDGKVSSEKILELKNLIV